MAGYQPEGPMPARPPRPINPAATSEPPEPRPHPWLPEAHERATIEQPAPTGRLRNWCRRTWRRFLHPQRLQVLLCPFCESILIDPSDNCPGCGL